MEITFKALKNTIKLNIFTNEKVMKEMRKVTYFFEIIWFVLILIFFVLLKIFDLTKKSSYFSDFLSVELVTKSKEPQGIKRHC